MELFFLPVFLFFFFIGVMLLFFDLFPAPSKTVRAAINSYGRQKKKSVLSTQSEALARKILPYIRIGKYKRMKMESVLNSVHIEDTPEQYAAKALAPLLLLGAFLVPTAFIIHPLFAVATVFLLNNMYRHKFKTIENSVKKKKEEIALELPHFAATVAEEMKKGRNVLSMLKSYSKVCGKQLRIEMDITIADMQTSNYQDAIGRLSNRVGSIGLTQICRGLQSAMDGNNQQIYFQVLTQSLEQEQEQISERQIKATFDKLRPYSFLNFGCMFAIIMTAIIIFALEAYSKI